MSDSKKIVEAFENLQVSLNLGAETCQNITGTLKATVADILILEEATTVQQLFDQLIKMRESGNIQKFIQLTGELTFVLKDALRETVKTATAVEAECNEIKNEVRKLGETIDDLNKRINEGDSWREDK